MIVSRIKVGWLLLILLVLAGCQMNTADDELSGHIVFFTAFS